MRGLVASLAILVAMLCWQSPALAISPEEQLSDKRLEQRARDLSAQLRCLVCQNQSIDDSDAELAKDLRREVRGQLSQGLADEVILANLQRTYGDYILLNPPVSRATYILWSAPFLLLLCAIGMFWHTRRHRTAEGLYAQDDVQEQVTQQVTQTAEGHLSARLTGGIALVIVALSAALYSQLGSPQLDAQPLEDRQQERLVAQQQDQQQKAALQQALSEATDAAALNPDSVEAQLSLALAYARLDDFGNEIAALRRALRLSDGAPVIKAMLAEALSRQADGQITLPARDLIAEVLGVLPNEPRALFMAGLAAYQDEAYGAAVEIWSQLYQTAPKTSPWPQLAKRNIITAAQEGGLDLPEGFDEGQDLSEAASAIANASDADQQEMIKAMVEGLEARLGDNPDDRQGWQRLVQARRVLNDREGLLRALAGAAKAQADNKDAQLDMLEAVLVGNQEQPWLDAAEQALARLSHIDDKSLEYLFFAGHIARLRGDAQQARGHWQQLYDLIGDGDEGFKAQLKQQIESLK